MKFILKLRNEYYTKRRKYCDKQYKRYSQLLENHNMFCFFVDNIKAYNKHKEYLSKRCKKYAKQYQHFSERDRSFRKSFS